MNLDPATNLATVDYDQAEFICTFDGAFPDPTYNTYHPSGQDVAYPSDFRLIKTGNEKNNFLLIDYDYGRIFILKIDETTG